MDSAFRTIFTYSIDDKTTATGETSSFKTVDELKTIIKNGKDYYKKPYNLMVEYTIQKIPGECQSPIVLKNKQLNMLVCDGSKMMYAKDIRKKLFEKYLTSFDFDSEQKWSDTQLMCFGGVIKYKNYKFSSTGIPIPYETWYNVIYKPVDENTIIVDDNLNQIWPKKTGKIPTALKQLLSKGKEKTK